MDGPAWAWKGILARASATNATVAQRCPIMERREILCGQSLGGPTLSVSRVVRRGRAARDSCTSRQLMPHHHSARAGRAARRHVNPAAQTARPARHGTSTCVQVVAVPRRRFVGACVAAGGAGRARHSPRGPGLRRAWEREGGSCGSAPRLCSATRVNGRDGNVVLVRSVGGRQQQ